MFPQKAPTERDAPFPVPYFIHISKSPVYEPSNREALQSEQLTLNWKTPTSTVLTLNEVLFTRSIIIIIIIISSLAAEAVSIIWPRSLFGPQYLLWSSKPVREIVRALQKSKAHHRIHKSSPLVPILYHMNPVQLPPPQPFPNSSS